MSIRKIPDPFGKGGVSLSGLNNGQAQSYSETQISFN